MIRLSDNHTIGPDAVNPSWRLYDKSDRTKRCGLLLSVADQAPAGLGAAARPRAGNRLSLASALQLPRLPRPRRQIGEWAHQARGSIREHRGGHGFGQPPLS